MTVGVPFFGAPPLTGVAETTMAEILGTSSQMATIPLTDPKTGRSEGTGTVSVRMDEVEHQHDLVTIKLRAKQVMPERLPGGGGVILRRCGP